MCYNKNIRRIEGRIFIVKSVSTIIQALAAWINVSRINKRKRFGMCLRGAMAGRAGRVILCHDGGCLYIVFWCLGKKSGKSILQ